MFQFILSGSTKQNECLLRDRNRAVLTQRGRGSKWVSYFTISWTLLVGCLVAPPAQAGFIGNYDFSKFTTTIKTFDPIQGVILNSVSAPAAGATYDSLNDLVKLTGGNDGSGNPGTVDFFLTVQQDVTLSFQFSFATLDIPLCGAGTDPCDPAGYFIDNTFTQLAGLDGDSGSVVISPTIKKGQVFGFRVMTVDNSGEPGILTISNFNGRSASSAVPEPGTLSLFGLAAMAVAGVLWRNTRTCRRSGGEV